MPVGSLARSLPLAGLLLAGEVLAQEVAVPTLVLEGEETEDDASVDLRDLVLSAAKRVATIQEVPMIVTVITDGDMARWRFRDMAVMMQTIPGWRRQDGGHGNWPFANARGTLSSAMILRDGVPLGDPINMTSMGPGLPLEVLKRVEVITGPGGVLWGANSFLGQVNLITKDAEDIDGIQPAVTVGSGSGLPNDVRASVLLGLPKILSRQVKLVLFTAYEQWDAPRQRWPLEVFEAVIPRPLAPMLYGPMVDTDGGRARLVNFDGKFSVGKLDLIWSLPYYDPAFPVNPMAGPAQATRVEDSLPECSPLEPTDPDVGDPNDACADRARTSRRASIAQIAQYVIGQYRASAGRTDVSIKGYFQRNGQHERTMVLNPIHGFLEGGARMDADMTIDRLGGSLDLDIPLADRLKFLVGGEAYLDRVTDTVEHPALEGMEGVEVTFPAPYDPGKLHVVCPVTATWDEARGDVADVAYVPGCPTMNLFSGHRTTTSAFTTAALRLSPRMLLDGGVRVLTAPAALSSRSFDPRVLGSATANYMLSQAWYLKLNVAQGMRSPQLYHLNANPQSFAYLASPDLDVERAIAYQGEVIGRLLRGRGRIVSLDVRADVSYARLEDIVLWRNGVYENFSAPRGITSVEVLSRLNLKGESSVGLAYNYLRIASAESGVHMSVPAHWFRLSGNVSLVPKRLEVVLSTDVQTAAYNPNRRIDVSGLEFGENGRVALGDPGQVRRVAATDLVFDRQPPSALIDFGLRYQSADTRFGADVMVYNALNAKAYQIDPYSEFNNSWEQLSWLYEGFRVLGSVQYRY